MGLGGCCGQTPGCQAQNWPAASFLPGEAHSGRRQDVMLGRGDHPFPGLQGLPWVIGAPSCPWGGQWSQALSSPSPARFPAVFRGSAAPRSEQGWGELQPLLQHSRKPQTSAPAGTTQADRNNQRLYLGWNEISLRGHQAPRTEQKLSLADKRIFEPQKWGCGGGALSMAQHTCFPG